MYIDRWRAGNIGVARGDEDCWKQQPPRIKIQNYQSTKNRVESGLIFLPYRPLEKKNTTSHLHCT